MVRVTAQANQELRTRFAISYYPTLVWAAPPILAFGDRIAKGGEAVEEVKDSHTAEKLLAWINKKLSKYVLHLGFLHSDLVKI